ncbi:MAG TPA: divergent polysaccharide deacetylase family protein [Verrucomicrobiae bacterium]|nr:divergent polysaccharide deacetylase family protein [Verrucomicrobiae bacterium]
MARPKRKPRGPAILVSMVILAIGAVVGCSLLKPAQPSHPSRTASESAATATPLQIAEPTAPATATPAPSATPAPTALTSGPKLAIIIDDCGQWLETERGFIALSVPLTLSVLPDVHYTGLIQREAAAGGKGVMLHLPMEAVSGVYPGPGEVTTGMTDAAIRAMVTDDLAQVPLAQGINNHEGSKGSADARVMGDVVDVLVSHGGLFFIDSRTAANSVAEHVAADAGLPTAARDVFLDNQATVAYSEAQLREAIAVAKRTGSAIAIGHPRPTTLQAVRAMLPEIAADGVELVFARDLVIKS